MENYSNIETVIAGAPLNNIFVFQLLSLFEDVDDKGKSYAHYPSPLDVKMKQRKNPEAKNICLALLNFN